VYANYGLFTLIFLVLNSYPQSSAWPMSSATLSLVASLISDVRAGSLISAEQSSSQAAAAAKQVPPGSKQAEEPAPTDPELERRLALLKSVGEECVTEPELRSLLKKPSFILYDGFEPSGRMHIAQGVFKAMNVNKCTAAGGTFIFWVADWFALMNDKMGGDLERIIFKALEKDREVRYQSASALGDDLRAWLAGDPVSAGPPGTAYRVRKLVA
jgi:hypothetical protein